MDFLHSLQPDIIWIYAPALFRALLVTLWLTVAASIIGLVAGTALAAAERIVPILSWLVTAYVEAFRNTPLLIQLMWIHFVLPLLTGVPMSPVQSGLLTLTLSGTAYFAEIIRSGIAAVPRSQWEAANALGLKKLATFRLVIIPQAITIMIPPIANMILSVFKGTTVLSILSVGEFLQAVNRISNYTFKAFEIFTFALIVYIIIGTSFDFAVKYYERRLGRAERR